MVPKTKDPVGAGDNIFSKWTIKADDDTVESDYTFGKRQIYEEDSTITAQYGTGKIKIIYVDQNGNEIDKKYQIAGQDYPSEKSGGLGGEANDVDFATKGPDFKGYVFNTRDSIKGKHYKDPADPNNLDVVEYKYNKKVTTDEPTNENAYFPVIFDANGGNFETDPKNQKIVYVYFDGNNATVEKVTFKEVKDEFEKAYKNPTKDGFDFKEWQDKADKGSAVADNYEIQFKGWDSQTYEAIAETFYAHYGKASALISYLDLNGKAIVDDFKIDGVEYPTEKEGTDGEAIAKDVYTADTAPKLIGYKFNRIELNPKDGKYALENKATIKIYYEKLPDVVPEKDGSGKTNEKPDGYVEVKFVPTDKAKDETEKIFYVNPKKDVTIPIANPEAIATYTFKEWKMGADAKGEAYIPSTAQKFTEKETVITATYGETENIIPYDPSDPNPMARPDGYVRVTFAAENGLKLTEQKAYYVKANAGITLGDKDLVKPKYDVETGYKFDKWNKEDSLEIKAADIVVTAKATKLDNVIPEKDKNDKPNEKPKGYKEVIFVVKTGDEAKGSITGVAKFYVNPTEYVTINPPTTEAETGFVFGTWDKDATIPTVYKEDTTITGSFNGLKDIIPKTNPDGTENKQPEGYKTVDFVIDPAEGGKIVDKEVTIYYVNPAKEITVPQPKTQAETGYEFKEWDQDTSEAKKYTEDTTVKGSFTKLKDIIPGTDGEGNKNPIPDGYVTVTFVKGDHGKEITGQTVYYVNPDADPAKTLGDKSIVKPKVKAETGWKQKTGDNAWDYADTKAIQSDITVTAKYEPIADVIPKTTDDESEKPEGYITVSFSAEEHGKLTGTSVFYLNPNKAVALKDKAPEVTANTGYDFAGWDTQVEKAIQYKDKDVIKAKYNEKDDVIPQEKTDGSDKPAGYLTVTFDKGKHGELSGKTVYYVRPNKEVTVPAPTVTPETGWKQKDGTDAWDKALTQTFSEDTKITAQYQALENIIPGDQTKPKGYVTVTFKADGNGTLAGTTSYHVNPKVEVDLTEQANGIAKNPNTGFTAEGGTWDKELKQKFDQDTEITFSFKALPDVIEGKEGQTKPEGYVKVEFIAGENGSLEGGNKTYYVNPLKDVKVGSENLPIPKTKANKNYTFDKWLENIDENEVIKSAKKYVATFKLNKVTMTYKAEDATAGKVPAALSYDIGTEITLAGGNDLKKDNHVLTGWKIGDKVYKPGEKFTINENTEAVAVWEAGLHTVEFNTNGGTYLPSQKVKHDTAIGKVTPPEKDGYTFTGWTLEGKPFNPLNNKVTKDITLVAQYVKDIVPQEGNDRPDNVPEDFVLVEFKQGEHGSLDGTTKYWVNPEAGKKVSDLTKPTVKAEENFKHTGWDKEDTTEIKAAMEITAKYKEKVVTKDPEDTDYVKVDFTTTKGSLKGNSEFWVLKDEKVTLTAPIVEGLTGYTFKAWDPEVKTSYSKDTTHKATFDYSGKDIIPQDGNDKPDNVPENFVLVEFKAGDYGKLEGTTKYWVNPNKEVDLTSKAPTVTPDNGYNQKEGFNAWDHILKSTFKQNTTITAQYDSPKNIIPQKGEDKPANVPDNYVLVEFKSGDNGTLEGTTKYWVNPYAGLKNSDLVEPKIKANIGYKIANPKWNPEFDANTEIKTKASYTAQYEKIKDIIPGENNEKPEGYVKVTFLTNENGTLTGETVYYVNPKAGKTIKDITLPTINPKDDYKKGTPEWSPNLDNDNTEITADRMYVANYEAKVKYPSEFKICYVSGNPEGGTVDKPSETVAVDINAPKDAGVIKGATATAKDGYKFVKWIDVNGNTVSTDAKLVPTERKEATYIAVFEKTNTVIVVPGPSNPTDEKDPNKPDGGRIGGKDRTDTAIEISKKYYGQADTVIVVDRKDFPDAMTASVLSKLLNAPILLTETNRLDPRVAAEIQRLGARDVIIVGGNSSVSEAVKKELAKFDKDTVERIYGRDRYETSAQVARRVVGITGKIGHGVVASGEVFADALTVAPFVAREGYPILLVKRNSVPPTINKAIKDLSITKVTIAGGYSTVAKSLESSLPTVVERLRGNSRYETAIDIVNKKFNNANEIFLANGEQWMDALVIGPVGGILDIPILLTGANNAPKSLKDYIAKSKIEKITAIGGRSMVSDKVLNELSK